MYISKLYREEDREKILEFLKQNEFATLVTYDGEKPTASHLLMEVVEQLAQILGRRLRGDSGTLLREQCHTRQGRPRRHGVFLYYLGHSCCDPVHGFFVVRCAVCLA
jgi:hypothetical protein